MEMSIRKTVLIMRSNYKVLILPGYYYLVKDLGILSIYKDCFLVNLWQGVVWGTGSHERVSSPRGILEAGRTGQNQHQQPIQVHQQQNGTVWSGGTLLVWEFWI